jgi:hypothetical protein
VWRGGSFCGRRGFWAGNTSIQESIAQRSQRGEMGFGELPYSVTPELLQLLAPVKSIAQRSQRPQRRIWGLRGAGEPFGRRGFWAGNTRIGESPFSISKPGGPCVFQRAHIRVTAGRRIGSRSSRPGGRLLRAIQGPAMNASTPTRRYADPPTRFFRGVARQLQWEVSDSYNSRFCWEAVEGDDRRRLRRIPSLTSPRCCPRSVCFPRKATMSTQKPARTIALQNPPL